MREAIFINWYLVEKYLHLLYGVCVFVSIRASSQETHTVVKQGVCSCKIHMASTSAFGVSTLI